MAASELSVGTRLDWINHFINVANAVDHNVKKACGLNITQGRILFYISTHELMTIGNVGTMLFLKASTITASVNKLVDEGYISRSHDDADRRNVFIASTRKGIEVTPSFIPAVRKAYEEDVPRPRPERLPELRTLLLPASSRIFFDTEAESFEHIAARVAKTLKLDETQDEIVTHISRVLAIESISYFMSKKLVGAVSGGSHGSGGGSSKTSLRAAARVLKARKKAKDEGREMLPKDLFTLRGFICSGTDNACYKDDLEELWGVRPMELFAGTECSLVGTETWNRKYLYFFPDACFYEFLPFSYVRQTDRYLPTVTIDQVQPGEKYELVITSLRGGAFARYRTGDVYRCMGIGDRADHSTLPRFRYIDRVPGIIDIAGFTRITENSVNEVISLSHLPIKDWCAAKEFDAQTGHPFLHMYLEMEPSSMQNLAVSEEIIRHHLEIYFNYLDNDYESLKAILEMEPLQITFLQHGSFAAYEELAGVPMQRISPEPDTVRLLLSAMKSREPLSFWNEVIG